MSRLYKKFKLDQLKLAAKKKNENDLLRKAGCLGERPSEEPDPVFRILTDKINNLADRITTEIAQESAGDPVKTLRCEWAFYWESSRVEVVKNLDPPEVDALSNSFRETHPTVRELALSGADRFVDLALWEIDVFENVIRGAEAYSTANHFFGVYLGLKDPRVISTYLSDFARENADRRHEGRNKIKEELLVEYLRNPDRWVNKKAAVRELHEKYTNGHFSYRTVTNWLYGRDLLEQIRADHNL
jgi:hypothetical protein